MLQFFGHLKTDYPGIVIKLPSMIYFLSGFISSLLTVRMPQITFFCKAEMPEMVTIENLFPESLGIGGIFFRFFGKY